MNILKIGETTGIKKIEMEKNEKNNSLSITRKEDFPKWYKETVKKGELAENSAIRGCMVIKPYGYSIWEKIQAQVDGLLKELEYQNAYFPLFIPLSFFEKEAKHVEGFAKECAVVTHYRLKQTEEGLIPDPEAKLDEPLIVRPTSETIIGDSFKKWIKSYNDLPVKVNQWCNVVRWEHSTNIFLRTSEFLWQEAHTVHETEEEAREENEKVAKIYQKFMEKRLGIPVIVGEKSPGERFAGAVNSITFEMMMQDKKALQAGTTHYLGQNFSKASEIVFVDKKNKEQYGFTTSSGVTTRLIGAMIMSHGDDDGLRIPPRIAPQHVIIIPSGSKQSEELDKYIEAIAKLIKKTSYHKFPISVHVDKRKLGAGEKKWEWIRKGAPLRIEVGKRELDSNLVTIARRDQGHKEKKEVKFEEISSYVLQTLDEIQNNYFKQAKEFRDNNIRKDIETFDELKEFFTPKNEKKPEIHGGFVLAKWCGDEKTELLLKEIKVTIRCLPLDQSGTKGKCVITGKEATIDAIFGKSY